MIGLSMTASFLMTDGPPAREVVRAAEQAGLDHLQVGDHISFLDGTGFDGLLLAGAALAYQERLPVHVGLYLLALRHPLAVARQLADLDRIAPGRLVLGVGVGGEDRREFENCGVDPASRGRRTDESLMLLRELLTGAPVSLEGEFFQLDEARIVPPPHRTTPVLIGGRSDAALRRTARHGDGWLALWVSPERFTSATGRIDELAAAAGRPAVQWRHALNLWCGVDTAHCDGTAVLSAAMEQRYKLPFDKFRRWCPAGSAADVAGFITAYARAGCTSVTLVLHDADPFTAVESAAAIREHVRDALR
jgi:alkanesulfonate monooxygenase SsuD/methylene tetrahydromethanopterin reductase-like flavin-dependent oxidoreductase (luciferase family)